MATKRKIKIEIDCGETTCYSDPGKPCQYVVVKHSNQGLACVLFPSMDSPHTDLTEDENGWLVRCDKCIRAEKILNEVEIGGQNGI